MKPLNRIIIPYNYWELFTKEYFHDMLIATVCEKTFTNLVCIISF